MSYSNDNKPKSEYVRKTRLNNNSRRIRGKSICPDCKGTNDFISFFSSKVNRFEEIVDNFKKLPKKKTDKFSKFNKKSAPCELEYDLSNFTFEDLQKLANYITPISTLSSPTSAPISTPTSTLSNSSDKNDEKY